MASPDRAHSIAPRLYVTLAVALASAPGAASAGQAATPCPAIEGRVGDVELRAADGAAAAKRWDDAAKAYRTIALGSAGSDAGRAAVKGYFKATGEIAALSGGAWPPILDQVDTELPQLVRLYCGCQTPKEHPEPCLMILLTRRDFARHSEPAATEPAAKRLEAWARAELAVWQDGGAAMCEARLPGCDRMGSILNNAAGAFEAAGMRIEALKVRKMLAEPRYGLDATEEAAKAMRALGNTYEALGAYDIAAMWYSKVASAWPSWGGSGSEGGAAEALERAIHLRVMLGDTIGAEEGAAMFAKHYGEAPPQGRNWVALAKACPACPPPRPAWRPSGLGRIALRFAAASAERGAWSEARARLDEVIKRVDQGASLPVKILVHARLGRASLELGEGARAAAEFAKVEAAWRDAAAVAAAIEVDVAVDAPPIAILAEALSALGEARFFRAEVAREKAVRFALPAYKGPDTRAGVLAFVAKVVAPWMMKKRELIESASDLYRAVLAIEPEPPPKWVIASAWRVGSLWADFVDEIKRVPAPPEWRRRGPIPGAGGLTYEEVRAAYESSTSKLSEPLLQLAKGAFEVCVNTSTRSRVFDQSSAACERWLSDKYPGKFHAMSELFAPPSKMSPPAAPRPAIPGQE